MSPSHSQYPEGYLEAQQAKENAKNAENGEGSNSDEEGSKGKGKKGKRKSKADKSADSSVSTCLNRLRRLILVLLESLRNSVISYIILISLLLQFTSPKSKKQKVGYTLEEDVQELIDQDAQNAKMWEECRTVIDEGKSVSYFEIHLKLHKFLSF